MSSLIWESQTVDEYLTIGLSCNVTPLNPTTLTATSEALPNGTMNVMIQCKYTDDDGTVASKIRWYDPDRTRLATKENNQFGDSVPISFYKSWW